MADSLAGVKKRMTDSSAPEAPARWLLVLAFGIVYLLWGSVYLAIAFAIDTLPPFLMMAVRLGLAGAVLYVAMRWRGQPRPTRAEWGRASIAGALLMFGGVGIGAWAQQWVPSGLTGVLIATIPLWMTLMDWVLSGTRPGGWVMVGLVFGLVGIGLVVRPEAPGAAGGSVNLFGAVMMLGAAVSWAGGSLYTIRTRLPESVLMVTGMQMLTGGVLLLAAAALSGEVARFDISVVSVQSALAMLYLVIFPGIVTFAAYNWLLRVSSPARASTYAYVNPVVALLLGWVVGGESLSAGTLVGAGVILLGVVFITVRGAERPLVDEPGLGKPLSQDGLP